MIILFKGCEVRSVRLFHIEPDRKPRAFGGPLHLRTHLPHTQGWFDNRHVKMVVMMTIVIMIHF